MKPLLIILFGLFLMQTGYTQELFSPSGTIGSSSTGNVGIGTSSPDKKLSVYSSESAIVRFHHSGSSTISGYRLGRSGSFGDVINLSSGFGIGAGTSSANLPLSSQNTGHVDLFISGSTSNIGIGTTTPAAKLDIEGGDVFVGEESSSNGTRRQLRVYGYDAGTKFFGSLHSNYDDSKRTFDISADAAQQIKLDVSSSSSGRILLLPGSLGNVGVGTKNPSSKFDVEGGDFYLGNEVSNNGERRLFRIYGFDNNSQFYGTIHSNWEDSKRTFDIYTSSSTNQLKIDASANPSGRIALLPGENVGVGVGTLTTGSHKLAVEGSIGAREIKVTAPGQGWPDYVFAKDYELRSLEDVERFVEENQHLPDIPSQEEVIDEGVNLGEMNAKLLQKVEELTLYLIDQNRELKAANQRIELLEQKMTGLGIE